MNKTIPIVLAEDHKVVLEGIVALLSAQRDLQVVAVSQDGLDALAQCYQHKPDVLVTDIGLPGLNGIELTRRIRKELPQTAVLALSMYDDVQTVERAMLAGALGYLLKGGGISDLCNGIRQVAAGKMFFGAGIPNDPGLNTLPTDPLSDREREVLQLVAEGYTAKEIAQKLGLSPRTVENHRSNIMDRLGIRTIAGLVRYAIRNGISI